MRAYIFGAGASKYAGYPLASQLRQELSAWLDRSDSSVHWVPRARNRMVQVRETFGSLDDFEGILGKLEEYGYQRVRPTGPTTYSQDAQDILHDCMERMQGSLREPFATLFIVRGYRHRGTCGDGAAPLLKQTSQSPVMSSKCPTSDCQRMEHCSLTRRHSPQTQKAGLWKRGRQDVMLWHPKPLWVASPFHRCSFDSRYFGPVSTTAIRHRLKALLML